MESARSKIEKVLDYHRERIFSEIDHIQISEELSSELEKESFKYSRNHNPGKICTFMGYHVFIDKNSPIDFICIIGK